MRNKSIFTVLFFIFIFSSFTVSAGNICLITDEFWNAMLDNELSQNPVVKFKNKVSKILPFIPNSSFRIENRSIKKLIIESERLSDIDYIIDSVRQVDDKIFILSPLMSGMLSVIAKEFPERFFIGTSEVETENLKNVSIFIIDYADAYFEAGEWTAVQDSEVSAVFYIGLDRFIRAEESFLDGWSSIKAQEKLNLTTFSEIDDVTQDFIEEFSNSIQSDKNIVAVFAGPHNESFINRFDGTSVLIVSEYMKSWDASSYNKIGSIEVPITEILSVIIKSVIAESYMEGEAVKADFFVYEHQ